MPHKRYTRPFRYVSLYGLGLPAYLLAPWARRPEAPRWISLLGTPRRQRAGPYQVALGHILHNTASPEWQPWVKSIPLLVAPGAWDQVPLASESWETEHVRKMLIDGVDYRALPLYAQLNEELARRGYTRHKDLRSPEEIDQYFNGIIELAESIRQNGLTPGREHGDKEIQVRVNRDGQIIKCGEGTHRLAIAQILGVAEEVTVEVDLVHWLWAKRVMAHYDRPFLHALSLWFEHGTPKLDDPQNPPRDDPNMERRHGSE
ncbi:hypothetical protein CKO15_12580 [Halorhodospira abdelmalekii]|uniref:hypothetical protein n=1 Tax=Halorhodospira abdelmalekii TaxID=421629 RepID=UPI0019058F49|nr:hypothetical protein [Halorhodospira abdelmalekii]MBK1736091.1 hypothetical protein [Halorhodospira abdelmalekii]